MTRQTHNDLLDHEALRVAVDVPYDNTVSGLTATELQGAVDELAAGAGASTLDALTNVDTTGKADGDIIYWDAGSSLWKVEGAPGGTVPSGSALGDILVWDGASWATLPAGTDTYVLTANSAATLGVDYEPGTGGGGGGDTTNRTKSEVREECFFSSLSQIFAGGLIQFSNAAAGITTASGTAVDGHPGIIEFGPGTTTTGRVGLAGSATLQLGTGAVTFAAVATLQTLSNGTNRYTVVHGVGGSTSTASPNECVYFRYADNVNSGKWQGVVRNGGTETAVDTGVTADSNFHTFAWIVDATGANVDFFIDNASVGTTITTNIPTFVDLRLVPFGVFKSLGTTSLFFDLDAYWYVFDF